MLYIIPTPIGNLEDITLRAIRILGEVDGILAEDTRVTAKLLKHLEIQCPIMSHHKNNEHSTLDRVIQRLNSGETLALVSDAGTPSISDPGFLLVRRCVEEDIPVETLPGPTAFVPALVNSGLPCERFHFEGFLPHKKGRQTAIARLAEIEVTFVLYESPHRIIKSLRQLAEACGEDRRASVSRELSKMFEETARGTLIELADYFEEKGVKGEFVVVVAGK